MLKCIFLSLIFLFSACGLAEAGYPLVKIVGEPVIIDMRYNSENNFLKKNIYARFGLNECLVRNDVAYQLSDIVKELDKQDLKLVVWDCYRPVAAQKMMWKMLPDEKYVADPRKGSNHSRGVAIDVTLARINGILLPMPTDFDDFSPTAASAYKCPESEAEKCLNRDNLIKIMKIGHFEPSKTEWWHFQLPSAKDYSIIEKIGSNGLTGSKMCLRPAPFDDPSYGNGKVNSADGRYQAMIKHGEADTSEVAIKDINSGKVIEMPSTLSDIAGICWHPRESSLYFATSPIYSEVGIHRWSDSGGRAHVERLDSVSAISVFKNSDDDTFLNLIDIDEDGRRLFVHFESLNEKSSVPEGKYVFDLERKIFIQCAGCMRENWSRLQQ